MLRKQMLIVDDNNGLREALKSVFEDEYDISFAASGEDVLTTSAGSQPHVVLMDYHMPGLDGVQTMQLLKDRSPNSQVIIMSAHDEQPLVAAAYRSGASDFVGKPFNLEEIKYAVRQASINAEKILPFAPVYKERKTVRPEHYVSQAEVNDLIDQTLQVACI